MDARRQRQCWNISAAISVQSRLPSPMDTAAEGAAYTVQEHHRRCPTNVTSRSPAAADDALADNKTKLDDPLNGHIQGA